MYTLRTHALCMHPCCTRAYWVRVRGACTRGGMLMPMLSADLHRAAPT